MAEQQTAQSDGFYTLHDDATGEDHQFFVAKGDPIPAEATGFEAGDAPGTRPAEDETPQTGNADADATNAEADTAANKARRQPGPNETR